ncbi:MAG: hypothetical protein ACOYBL_10580 [Lachnospiraceae bacterium]|jgi:hypothetical protein
MGLLDEKINVIAINSTKMVHAMENYLGDSLSCTFEEDPEQLYRLLFQLAHHPWSSRLLLAKRVTEHHPEFMDTYLHMQKNYDEEKLLMDTLGDECDELTNYYSSCDDNLDYLTLMTCYAWACYLYNEDTAEVLDTLLNRIDERTGEDFSAIASVLMGGVLWKANYKNFHTLAMEAYRKNKAEAEAEAAASAKIKAEEEAQARAKAEREQQIRNWKQAGKCSYCGGNFKGLFKKVCTACGREKNY